MTNPRLRHLPGGKKTRNNGRLHRPLMGVPAAKYAEEEFDFGDRIKRELGSEWYFDSPQINPARVLEFSAESPMGAARMLQHGCMLLAKGRNIRLREYLVSAYFIAAKIREDPYQIQQLADCVVDGRTKARLAVKQVEGDLLRYFFIYIFHQSGFTTRNRATQYADSLRVQFDDGQDVFRIEQQLLEYGQDKLRKAYQEYSRINHARESWERLGNDSRAATFEEVLSSLKGSKGGNGDDRSDRDLNNGDDDLTLDLGGAMSSTDDKEDNPNNFLSKQSENACSPEHVEPTENLDLLEDADAEAQIPEVDEFFEDSMRSLARLTVGINEAVACPAERATLLGQLRQLGVKAIMFRGLMA